jgi:AbrB family looped-hinge helix DNA binding protein
MCHTFHMSQERFTTHVGDRGRFVLPADVRRRLHLKSGDLLVIDVDEENESLVVRKATDVAHGFRGFLGKSEPGRNFAEELLEERRAEAARDAAAAHP